MTFTGSAIGLRFCAKAFQSFDLVLPKLCTFCAIDVASIHQISSCPADWNMISFSRIAKINVPVFQPFKTENLQAPILLSNKSSRSSDYLGLAKRRSVMAHPHPSGVL